MGYCVTNEAHRLPKHEDYILVDDSEWCGEEEPGDGDVRSDETHLGLISEGMYMCEMFGCVAYVACVCGL
jgi:hypothetical protein